MGGIHVPEHQRYEMRRVVRWTRGSRLRCIREPWQAGSNGLLDALESHPEGRSEDATG